jgi:outer membrane protein assembly factor BamB
MACHSARLHYYPMHFRLVLFCMAAMSLAAADAWPTLHGDLQRSGFYDRFPRGPLKLAWRKELWRELTGPRAEVIVADGLAFMGTYAGNLHAWDAVTGADRWIFKTGGAIGHSPTERSTSARWIGD